MRNLIAVLSVLSVALAGSALAANEKAKTDDGRAGSTLSNAEVRDWSKIDTDHDGYVEPEEMEKYLQTVWAQHGKNTTAEQKPAKSN
jgi:hypothetical protein